MNRIAKIATNRHFSYAAVTSRLPCRAVIPPKESLAAARRETAVSAGYLSTHSIPKLSLSHRPISVALDVSLKGKKVFFEDPQSAWSQPRVAYDGTPYVILGKRIYDCQQGADRHAADKMPKEAKEVGGAILR